jgi:hypothetical protein
MVKNQSVRLVVETMEHEQASLAGSGSRCDKLRRNAREHPSTQDTHDRFLNLVRHGSSPMRVFFPEKTSAPGKIQRTPCISVLFRYPCAKSILLNVFCQNNFPIYLAVHPYSKSIAHNVRSI